MVAAVERKLGEARAALQQRRVLSLSSPVPSPPTASTSPLLDEVERHANELVSRVASLWLNATGRATPPPLFSPPSLCGEELQAWQRRALAMRAAAAPTARDRLLGALLKAAYALLVCGVLALAAATLHVAWASRGDACRGLAAARGTLAMANATLTDAQVRHRR